MHPPGAERRRDQIVKGSGAQQIEGNVRDTAYQAKVFHGIPRRQGRQLCRRCGLAAHALHRNHRMDLAQRRDDRRQMLQILDFDVDDVGVELAVAVLQ